MSDSRAIKIELSFGTVKELQHYVDHMALLPDFNDTTTNLPTDDNALLDAVWPLSWVTWQWLLYICIRGEIDGDFKTITIKDLVQSSENAVTSKQSAGLGISKVKRVLEKNNFQDLLNREGAIIKIKKKLALVILRYSKDAYDEYLNNDNDKISKDMIFDLETIEAAIKELNENP